MQEFVTPPWVDRGRWRLVRDLFEEALEVPPEQLEPWLRDHEPDPQVRQEVASLLDHHSRAGRFLEAPIGNLEALLDQEPAIAVGSQIGPYAIVQEAGRGGMGRVYRATDNRLGRTIALKALPPDLAGDPSQRERLRREARALASLTHPNICTVHALEEFSGELYMIAEFVEGDTLRQEIARGPLPAAEAVGSAARELASALACAHAKGIAHRDLKPENVMRAAGGQLKVLDFGLARVEAAAGAPTAAVTQPGVLLGTPTYMSPEQLSGRPADARTDVFALGVLLYEYATGLHPFEAPTPLARAGRVLEAEPEPLAVRRPDLPPTLLAAVTRCLRKSPDDRFANAGELLASIDRPREASAATPLLGDLSPSSPASRWWQRHQIAVTMLYLVAAVLAWQIKEWRPDVAGGVFVGVGLFAAIGGVLRGHLLFTASTHRRWLAGERRRLGPVTAAIDVLLAAALAAGGLLLVPRRAVAGVLVLGLAVGIALARLVLEPATTRAAFPDDHE